MGDHNRPASHVSGNGVRSSAATNSRLTSTNGVDGVPPARRTAGRRIVGALGLGALPLIVVMLSNRGVRLFAAAVRHASTIEAAPITFVVPG